MSEGSKWTPGKIFLLIVAILVGLGVVCCGAGWLLWGDKIKSGIAFGTESAAFIMRLQKDYGKGALFGMEKNDRMEMILTIGVEGDLTPDRVVEVENGSWKALGEIFGKDGFFPVKYVAVGRPISAGQGKGGGVVDWSKNVVSVEDLVKRTGVPAPPMVAFLPDAMGKGRFNIKIEPSDDETPKDKDDKENDGGGGGK